MEKKKKTYLLLTAVLLVWGIIGYKIYKQFKPEPVQEVKESQLISFKTERPKNQFTYTLHKDYRDPFLGNFPIKKRQKTAKKRMSKTIKSKPKKISFPRIIYNGLITPKKITSHSVFMIAINGKNELFKVGQTNTEVKLLYGTEKEVQVQYKDSIQTFHIKK